MSISKIGKILKRRRKTLRVTQPQLAELANISVNTLYRIERGQANPTYDTLDKLVSILGMEITLEIRKHDIV